MRPGIVHRLDKDTSGILVAAKTDSAHLHLSSQFKQHTVKRQYQAIVWGVPSKEHGIVEAPIARHPVRRKEMSVIKSNGVTIATVKDANIRAVFDGEVMSILSFKGSNPTILIRHGNYISTYKNIGKVFVKKGDKILSKQVIGEAFTHPSSGKTTIQFGIFEGIKPINPKIWIYKM